MKIPRKSYSASYKVTVIEYAMEHSRKIASRRFLSLCEHHLLRPLRFSQALRMSFYYKSVTPINSSASCPRAPAHAGSLAAVAFYSTAPTGCWSKVLSHKHTNFIRQAKSVTRINQQQCCNWQRWFWFTRQTLIIHPTSSFNIANACWKQVKIKLRMSVYASACC